SCARREDRDHSGHARFLLWRHQPDHQRRPQRGKSDRARRRAAVYRGHPAVFHRAGALHQLLDQEHARPVVVLGAAIAESLFPYTDAVGKTVRINGSNYEVIGVFEHDQGLFIGPGVDAFAIIPLSDFKKKYPEAKELILVFTVPKGMSVEK